MIDFNLFKNNQKMNFLARNAFLMDSGANKRKDEIAKSGFAQSNAHKTTTTGCNQQSFIGMLKYIPASISNEFKPIYSILMEVI